MDKPSLNVKKTVKDAAVSQMRVAYVGTLLTFVWILGLLLTPTAQRFGTDIEHWANPIVSEFSSTNWRHIEDTGFWRANIRGIKERASCLFDPDYTVNGLVALPDTENAVPFEIPIAFPHDLTPGSTRPPGYQSFGVWEFQSDRIITGSVILVNVRHICHSKPGEPPISRISTVGPFTVR